MPVFFNLALPWLVLAVVALIGPSTLDPNLWILQGLEENITLYGIPAFTDKLGVLGIFAPLALLHNFTYLLVRLIQSRLDLEFLPMIRSVLAWGGAIVLAYWLLISFSRGARFGEFHGLVLALLPLLALAIGLAFFVPGKKGRASAQLTALLVAWAPAFSIVATLTGNYVRPQRLFSALSVEPGGIVAGWDELDEKTRATGYLRLSVEKEGQAVAFPALARDVKIELDEKKRTERFTADLDPVATKHVVSFAEQLEAAGWRPSAANSKKLSAYCAVRKGAEQAAQAPLALRWVKADATLTLNFERCHGLAKWSVITGTAFFSLGALDADRAHSMREKRETAGLTMAQADKALLTDRDWRQRKLGYGLLAQVNDPAAIALLGKGFYDTDVEVRQAAALGLLSWGSKVEEFLTKALSDSSPYMRGDALRIIALANRLKPHPAAFRLLADPDVYVRVAAAQSLAPFVRDSGVLKTLMQAFDREYAKGKGDALIKDPYVAELVIAIARADEVRTAGTLLKAMPKVPSQDPKTVGVAAFEAAKALRNMKNWLGADYLQALVKRSTTLENREKALSVMAYLREPWDESAYLKALQDDALRPHALTLVHLFESPAVAAELSKLSAGDFGAR